MKITGKATIEMVWKGGSHAEIWAKAALPDGKEGPTAMLPIPRSTESDFEIGDVITITVEKD